MIIYRFRTTVILLSVLLISITALAKPITSDGALVLLKEGNARFVSGDFQHPNISQDRRNETSINGQHPFVTILACSDSRVPVEFIFDQGIGDIFSIRIAGNVCDVDEIGSIEYGVHHLGTPLLVILGHTNCGAVTAVVEGAELHGSIPGLVDNIEPAAKKSRIEHPTKEGSELVTLAVEANVFQSIEDLFKNSKTVRDLVIDGDLKVVGALYYIETGVVNWLGCHSEQVRFLKTDTSHEEH
jgi:carbonic anhydrase